MSRRATRSRPFSHSFGQSRAQGTCFPLRKDSLIVGQSRHTRPIIVVGVPACGISVAARHSLSPGKSGAPLLSSAKWRLQPTYQALLSTPARLAAPRAGGTISSPPRARDTQRHRERARQSEIRQLEHESCPFSPPPTAHFDQDVLGLQAHGARRGVCGSSACPRRAAA